MVEEAEDRAMKASEEWWQAGLRSRRLSIHTVPNHSAGLGAMVLQRDAGSRSGSRSLSPLSSFSNVQVLGSQVTESTSSWGEDAVAGAIVSAGSEPRFRLGPALSDLSSISHPTRAAEGLLMSSTNPKAPEAVCSRSAATPQTMTPQTMTPPTMSMTQTISITVQEPSKRGGRRVMVYARPQSGDTWRIQLSSYLCIPYCHVPEVGLTQNLSVILSLNKVPVGTWTLTTSMLALRNATGHLAFKAVFPADCDGYYDLSLSLVRDGLGCDPSLHPHQGAQMGSLLALCPQDETLDTTSVTKCIVDGLARGSTEENLAAATGNSTAHHAMTRAASQMPDTYYCEVCDENFKSRMALGGHCSKNSTHKQRVLEVQQVSGILASVLISFKVRTIVLPPHSSISHFEGGKWAAPLRAARTSGFLQAIHVQPRSLGRVSRGWIQQVARSSRFPASSAHDESAVVGACNAAGRPKRSDKCWVIGHEIDLTQLVRLVDTLGGAASVTAKRQWRVSPSLPPSLPASFPHSL